MLLMEGTVTDGGHGQQEGGGEGGAEKCKIGRAHV